MNEDLARQRFVAMQAARLAGIVLALLGVLIVAGKLALPPEVGVLLFLVGLGEALFLPKFLASRWKSPPQ
jgi:hypothetical protein